MGPDSGKTMYWMTNEDWYRANEKTGKFELTPAAPPLAVESFKQNRKLNRKMRLLKFLRIK